MEQERTATCAIIFLDEKSKHARRTDDCATKKTNIYETRLLKTARRDLEPRGELVFLVFTCTNERCSSCDKSARRAAPPDGIVRHAVVVCGQSDEHAAEEALSALRRLVLDHPGRVSLSSQLSLVTVGWLNEGCKPGEEGRHLLGAARSPQSSHGVKRPHSPDEAPVMRASTPPAKRQPPLAVSDEGTAAAPAAAPIHPFFSTPRRPTRPAEPPPRAGSAGSVRTVHNRHLAVPLEELAVIYKLAPSDQVDQFRAVAFGKAAKLLQAWPTDITNLREYEAFLAQVERQASEARARAKACSVGKSRTSRAPTAVLSPHGSVAAVLREMVSGPPGEERSRCKRLQALLADEKKRAVLTFSTIYGVGPATAEAFFKKGLRTLDDLRADAATMATLTPQQRIGLRHVSDFAQRIPRAEVERIGARVRAALSTIVGDERIQFCQPVGSYRRGKLSSGDVDMLICLRDEGAGAGSGGKASSSVLASLVQSLAASGFVTDSLAEPHRSKGGTTGKATWMGVCLPEPDGLHRRLDIKFYPQALLPFALLYFTGADFFDRR